MHERNSEDCKFLPYKKATNFNRRLVLSGDDLSQQWTPPEFQSRVDMLIIDA